MSEAILFDGDQIDHVDDLSDLPRHLNGSQLLWLDLDERSDDAADDAARTFHLDDATHGFLTTPHNRAVFSDHGDYVHITAYAPCDDDAKQLVAIDCVVGESWVITAHDRPIPVLDEFAARVSGSGQTGSLDGPGFLAALLEWVLGAYTEAFESIEEELEDFDVHAMRGDGSSDDAIEHLISLRREVGRLRRALSAHRAPLVALTHPELVLLGNDESADRFGAVFTRFEATLQEARDAREVIVGAFDVLIARSGDQVNRIMTVLTLTSVILLPGALIAGVMGMNFKAGLFEHPWLFWVVVAVIVAIAPLTFWLAKRRGWI